jgi:hypothetical protein
VEKKFPSSGHLRAGTSGNGEGGRGRQRPRSRTGCVPLCRAPLSSVSPRRRSTPSRQEPRARGRPSARTKGAANPRDSSRHGARPRSPAAVPASSMRLAVSNAASWPALPATLYTGISLILSRTGEGQWTLSIRSFLTKIYGHL